MPLEIVTSWRTLFEYAHAAGQAKVLYSKHPSVETYLDMLVTQQRHDEYRDMCIKADRMIGLPQCS